MTTRRGFLGAILAAAAAPAIIKAEALMPVRKIITPTDPYADDPYSVVIGSNTKIHTLGGTMRLGDVFTMSGVVGAGGMLQQFVVTGVATGGVLSVRPALF